MLYVSVKTESGNCTLMENTKLQIDYTPTPAAAGAAAGAAEGPGGGCSARIAVKKAQLRSAPRAKKLEKLGVYSACKVGAPPGPRPPPGRRAAPGRAPSGGADPRRTTPPRPPQALLRARSALGRCCSVGARRRRLPGAERVPGSPSRGPARPARSSPRWAELGGSGGATPDSGLAGRGERPRGPGALRVRAAGRPVLLLVQPGRCPGSRL